MERRRLAVLLSHLCQTKLGRSGSDEQLRSCVSTASCDCSSESCESDLENENPEKDCVFCMIIRDESPACKLYEDDICLCILDTNPLVHGHSLIIPKCHFSSLKVTPPSVVAAMCSIVPLLSSAIMKVTHCDSFNLLVNSGAAAGQVIFHTHLHIIPRKTHDQLWTSKSFRRKPLKLDQDTAFLADNIREQLLLPVVEKQNGCSAGGSIQVDKS